MARYRFVTDWQIDAPIERVWDALLLSSAWPDWWRGFRSVEQQDPGDERGVGMRLRQRWRSRLPYTLEIDLEIVGVERHRLVEGRSTGAFEGTCRWEMDPRPDGTRVRFTFDVRTTRWWMNLPLPFARYVFAWNYGTIMRWGKEGLSRLLGVDVADRTVAPELAAT